MTVEANERTDERTDVDIKGWQVATTTDNEMCVSLWWLHLYTTAVAEDDPTTSPPDERIE